MAGNLPVTGGVEVKLTWTLNGVPAALNILHFHSPLEPAITQAKADAISAIYKTAFTASTHAAAVWTGVGLQTVSTRDMSSNENAWYVGAGAPVAGTSASNPLPAATSLCVSTLTGKRGRSFNGRIYLWGWTEDANDAQGGATAVQAENGRQFIVSAGGNMFGSHGLNPSVLSRFSTPPGQQTAIERNPPLLTPITAYVMKDLRWDVQRRRAVPGI
jgi:hypothetical protein